MPDYERERALEDAGRKLYAIAKRFPIPAGAYVDAAEKREALEAWEKVMLG